MRPYPQQSRQPLPSHSKAKHPAQQCPHYAKREEEEAEEDEEEEEEEEDEEEAEEDEETEENI